MKLLGLIISFSFMLPAYGLPEKLDQYLSKRWVLNKTEQNYLENQKILAKADVTSHAGKQNFDMRATAWHKKKCRRVIRKLSQFEQYPEWISFIKSLTYNEETKLITMRADHPLLPFPMIVHIIVDRPTKTGRYPFSFPTGIFTGLKGYFEIQEFEKRCHFYAESSWFGKKTKIPNVVIEVFSETLAKIGGEILIRKAR